MKEYTNKLQPRYQVYDILCNGVVDEICNYYNKKEGENNG